MRTSILYSAYFLVFLSVFSCSGDIEPSPTDDWSDFMPLFVGNTWEYEVESTRYWPDKTIINDFYLRKDSIAVEEIIDEGKIFSVYSFKKSTNSPSWVPLNVYLIKAIGNHLIVQNDGIDYLKIINPLKLGIEWNGNLYNTFEDVEYNLSQIESGNGNFDYLTPEGYIQVIENDNGDFIVNLKKAYAIYGRGIGLVEFYTKDLKYCQAVDCLGLEEIVEGEEEKIVLTEFIKR